MRPGAWGRVIVVWRVQPGCRKLRGNGLCLVQRCEKLKYYIMTHHGSFIGLAPDASGAAQIALNAISNRSELSSIDLPENLGRRSFGAFIANEMPAPISVEMDFIGNCIVGANPDGRTINIKYNGNYITADDCGGILNDRTGIWTWETFVLISETDLDFLQNLMDKKWIVKSSREIVSGRDITVTDGAVLNFGTVKIPMSFNVPFDIEKFPFQFPVFVDGWKIDEIVLFNPLTFYVAVGDENVLSQLYLSLESLVKVGKYDGKIVVFSDRSHEIICEKVPCLEPAKLTVLDVNARDWVGYVAGKYCILDVPSAFECQPVMYMDPDIIYNTNLESFMGEIALSDRIGAPIEHFSQLASGVSVGATLLQLDHEQPRYACGFNAGTLCIPNLKAHRQTLELIRRVIHNFLVLRGRDAFDWVDQESANYVSYKFGHFDTNYVSRCVEYGFEHTTLRLGALNGLVHFWPVARSRRPAVMRNYLDLLLAQDEPQQ